MPSLPKPPVSPWAEAASAPLLQSRDRAEASISTQAATVELLQPAVEASARLGDRAATPIGDIGGTDANRTSNPKLFSASDTTGEGTFDTTRVKRSSDSELAKFLEEHHAPWERSFSFMAGEEAHADTRDSRRHDANGNNRMATSQSLASQLSELSLVVQRLAADAQTRCTPIDESSCGDAADVYAELEEKMRLGAEDVTRVLEAHTKTCQQTAEHSRGTLDDHDQRLARLEEVIEKASALQAMRQEPAGIPPAEVSDNSRPPTPRLQRAREFLSKGGRTVPGETPPRVPSPKPTPDLDVSELRRIFELCDLNGDGHINKIELIKKVRDDPEVAEFFGLPQVVHQEDGTRDRFEMFFQMVDRDSDKRISWEELTFWYHTMKSGGGKELRGSEVSAASERNKKVPQKSLAPARISFAAEMEPKHLSNMNSVDLEDFFGKCESSAMPSSSSDVVFVFPLPTSIGQEEEKQFRSRHLGRQSYKSLIQKALLNPQSRSSASIDCGKPIESLAGTINCIIELMIKLFDSVATSHEGNCDIFTFTSVERDAFFVCIKFDDKVVETIAALQDYPVQLDVDALERMEIKITDKSDVEPAFVKYTESIKNKGLLKRHRPDSSARYSVLRQIDRIRLTYDRLADHIDIDELTRLGLIFHNYPAHHMEHLETLKKSWASVQFIFQIGQPIDEVRDYFGEEIAFYFLLLETWNAGLAIMVCPALIHFMLIYKYGHSGYSDRMKLFFTMLIMLWFTVTLKVWRRREAHYANKWGVDMQMVHTDAKDTINPDFKGKLSPSPLDENVTTLQVDPCRMVIGRIFSVFACIVWITIVLICVVANRTWAVSMDITGRPQESKLMTLVLGVEILIFDNVWEWLGNKLTIIEVHATLQAHHQFRAVKTFAMKFIHWFSGFLYMTYVQPIQDPNFCASDDCLATLRENLVTVLLVYSFFAIVDCVKPYIHMRYRVWKESQEFRSHHEVESYRLSFIEQQAKMDEYGDEELTVDYTQVIFPLAWIATFGTVMPTAALIAYVNLSLQQRVDAWRLVAVYKRPYPHRADGIGVWNDILDLLNYLSIFNLLGLLTMQVESIDGILPTLGIHKLGGGSRERFRRLATFFVLQNLAVICKLAFGRCVANVGPKTQLNRSRQELQRTRLFDFSKEEYDQTIVVQGSGDFHHSAFDQEGGLCPGDDRFEDPPSQACGCRCPDLSRLWRKTGETQLNKEVRANGSVGRHSSQDSLRYSLSGDLGTT